jgi:hypothetical protein
LTVRRRFASARVALLALAAVGCGGSTPAKAPENVDASASDGTARFDRVAIFEAAANDPDAACVLRVPPTITAYDSVTRLPVCDITVRYVLATEYVVGGAFNKWVDAGVVLCSASRTDLECPGPLLDGGDDVCSYGVVGLPGDPETVYQLEVSKPGYLSNITSGRNGQGGCAIRQAPTYNAVLLTPLPPDGGADASDAASDDGADARSSD